MSVQQCAGTAEREHSTAPNSQSPPQLTLLQQKLTTRTLAPASDSDSCCQSAPDPGVRSSMGTATLAAGAPKMDCSGGGWNDHGNVQALV